MRNKFFNEAETMTDEMLEGLSMVMDGFIDVDGHVVSRKGFKDDDRERVTCITIGGSGHEPSSMGFCGPGWECVKVIGDVFAAPGPAAVLEGLKMADKKKGIVFYVGNHAGDVMSAKMAIKMAQRQGIENIEMIIFGDDVSSFGRDEADQRRGMICSLGLGKVIGSACDDNQPLEKVCEVARKFIDNTASLSVATRGATHPATCQEISHINAGKMVIGMGQHGEGNGGEEDMVTSKEIVKKIGSRIIDDLKLTSGEKVLLVINGTGSSSYMELLIVYKDAVEYLKSLGIEVAVNIVGEYLTTQEQGGFQMSMTRLDDELLKYLKYPCRTFFKTGL